MLPKPRCQYAFGFGPLRRTRLIREHRLNTVKRSPGAQNENWAISIARTRSTKTLCSMLSIDSRIPKLDVAGSTPVSRSNFSKTYEPQPNPVLDPCSN
jgi:hypothetical protein